MQIALTFIEYFISGALTILWLPLYMPFDTIGKNETIGKVFIIYLVVFYVMGMLIDWVSARMIGPFKKYVRSGLKNLPEDEYLQNYKKHTPIFSKGAALLHLSKDLGLEHRALSSRDRMARGAILNFLILTCSFLSGRSYNLFDHGWEIGLSIAATVLAMAVWAQYEKHTEQHEVAALATVLLLEERRAGSRQKI